MLALPKEGTQVLIQFINGSPHKPIITAVIPNGLSLAKSGYGETIWQGGAGAYQSANIGGDWTRATLGTITDKSYERKVNAEQSEETYRNFKKTVLEDDKKLVAGNKEETIAGKTTTVCAEDITTHSAANIILSAASEIKLIAGKGFSETVKGTRTLKADKFYIGDQYDNILQLLFELMQHTADLASAVNQTGIAQDVDKLKLRLGKMLPNTAP